MEERIKYLEGRLGKTKKQREIIEAKYQSSFERFAQYLGDGVYTWRGIYSNDTRKLFLMGVLRQEGITFKTD